MSKFSGVLDFFGDSDNYIKAINPTGKRIDASDRPNLMMGDMYGMLPRGAQKVGEKDGIQFFRDGDDVYATAFNPDVGEMDVVGYHLSNDGYSDLQVVDEMKGRGIGEELSYLYRSENPTAPSGGLTEAGERTARKVYDRMFDDGIVSGVAGATPSAAGVLAALGAMKPEDALADGIGFEPQVSVGDYAGGVMNALFQLFGPEVGDAGGNAMPNMSDAEYNAMIQRMNAGGM